MLLLEVLSQYNVRLEGIDYIELALWIIVCGVLAFGSLFFWREYKKGNNSFFLMSSIEFVCFLAARVLRSYLKYYVGQPVGTASYPLDILILQIMIGWLNSIAIFLLYYDLERKQIKKTHYLFSIVSIAMGVIITLEALTRDLTLAAFLIWLFIIVMVGLPLMYLYIAIISSGSLRKRAIIIALGTLLTGIAFGMDQPTGTHVFGGILSNLSTVIVPIFQIIGFILVLNGFKRIE